MVLMGDFNAHSQCWDLRCTEWRDASNWGEIRYEHGLVIGNDDRSTHYWTRNKSQGLSTSAKCILVSGSLQKCLRGCGV